LQHRDSNQSHDREGVVAFHCYHILMSPRLRLERYFDFQALGANWRTEVLAGFTTVA
jgi:hypothetical protein